MHFNLVFFFFLYDCNIPRSNLSPVVFKVKAKKNKSTHVKLLFCFRDELERTYVVYSGVLST